MVGDRNTSRRLARLPLYVGGLMGPFGTGIMNPMIPELRDDFGVSNDALGLGWALYLIPFAALMLVSGTLAERWGRRRTARWTFALYALVTLVAAGAPNVWVFFGARALAGALNAFFTPILLAALAESTPVQKLGEVVGVYAAFQSFGSLLAPLVGGVAADVTWRAAFVLVAAVSLLLSLFPPPGEPRREAAAAPMRPLLTRPVWLLGWAAFLAAAGPIGIGVVVGLSARDELGLSGSAAGLVLAAGPVGAMFAGRPWGGVVDRVGARSAGVAAFVICSGLVAVLAGPTAALVLGLVWLVAGFTTNFIVVSVQSMAATAIEGNRAGAISFVLAHRFLGHAVGALIWLPTFSRNADAPYLGSAALGLVGALAIWFAATAKARS